MRQFATGLRKYVQENADYVGLKFADEARRIYYGETPERHIYGEATAEEAHELIEEGRGCRRRCRRTRTVQIDRP